jgi:hypothetical protein
MIITGLHDRHRTNIGRPNAENNNSLVNETVILVVAGKQTGYHNFRQIDWLV